LERGAGEERIATREKEARRAASAGRDATGGEARGGAEIAARTARTPRRGVAREEGATARPVADVADVAGDDIAPIARASDARGSEREGRAGDGRARARTGTVGRGRGEAEAPTDRRQREGVREGGAPRVQECWSAGVLESVVLSTSQSPTETVSINTSWQRSFAPLQLELSGKI
jgi:hypothetical protein